MKRKVAWSLLAVGVLVGTSLVSTQSASSNSSNQHLLIPRAVPRAFNLLLPLATTLTVDRTDDTAAATACTAAPNDCSLRGAVIAANADVSANPVIISLQPATTYSLTLANATQENAAATGDLDITTILHTVTIVGGGSSGPSATIINAAGLNTGSTRDRAFHLTGSGVTAVFQDLAIQNGQAADDGTSGTSTNPATQNTNRAGGGILDNGGSVTLTNVLVQSCQAQGRGDSNANPSGILEARGGGLASLGATGTVVITNSTFSGNTAQGGDGPGGVNNNVGSAAKGGSIYFEGGTLDMTGTRIDTSAANGGNGGSVSQDGALNGGFGGLAQGGGAWVGGGTVSITDSTFESVGANGGNAGAGGNGAEPAGGADGGGLYSLGNVAVSNSTFHLAGATGGRGGDAFGSTCLGAHNAGDGGGARGGAIFADGGTLVVNTATFANNFAMGGNGGDGGQTNGGCGMHGAGGLASGGALANNNAATINMKHGTLSLNNAQAGNSGVNQSTANKPPRLVAEGTGGGIRVGPASVTLENTIIAGNTAANGAGDTTGAPTPGPNVDGAVTSNGHNLLGIATEATGFSGTGDQTGADPMLAALADNGGPTQTMALSPGSPAIDAGVAAGATFDQRGRPRTYDDPGVANAATSDATDIGAFELQPLCSLSCPSDMVVANDTDQCGAVVNYTTPDGAGCGTVSCDHPTGSFFPTGDTMVTCTSSVGPSCSFKITVNDTQPPTVTPPANVSVSADAGSCSATLNPGVATATDNCGSATVVGVRSDSQPLNTPYQKGTTTITWTATDGSGNHAPAVQTIVVNDTQPPVISCQTDIIANFDTAVNGAVITFAAPVGTDNCPGAVTMQTTGLPSGSTFPLGTTTNTFIVTDASGNTASCSFKVTVALTSIVGLNSVSVTGAAFVDSYDSTGGYPATKSSLANVLSNGTITLANSGKVWGNVRSTQAGVVMSGASQVTGNATAGTTVSKSGSATVGGAITNNAPAPAIALPSVPTCGPPYSPNSGISGTYSYNAATGDLTLSGINVATLANGSYCFHNVTMTNSGQLKVNGPVVIRLTGTLSAGGATNINNTTMIPGNLRILSSYTGGSGVTISNGANAYLVVYAPQTGVTMSGAGPLFGTVAGKTVTVSNSGAIHYDIKLNTIWPDIWSLIMGP